MNRVELIGRITKDIELKVFTNQNAENKSYVNFSIAVNNGYGENKETSFFDCVVFGVKAENLCKFCRKGSLIAVEGRLKQDVYKNQNGENRSKISIICENIEYLTPKQEQNNQYGDYQEPTPQYNTPPLPDYNYAMYDSGGYIPRGNVNNNNTANNYNYAQGFNYNKIPNPNTQFLNKQDQLIKQTKSLQNQAYPNVKPEDLPF